MGDLRWASLVLLGWLAAACDGGGAGVEQVCNHLCQCQGATLPSQLERCATACTSQVAGEQVPQSLIDCYLAASCVELSTRNVCEPDDDDDGTIDDVDAGVVAGAGGDGP